MRDASPQELGLLPKLVIAVGVVLLVAGILWHGVTWAIIERIWRSLFERSSGPLSFRFILQPSMAAIAAILRILKNVRTGRAAKFRTLAHNPDMRVALLREGLNATARIILLGLAMDLIYQVIVFETFFPVEALIIAVLLGFVPYLVVRVLLTPLVLLWLGGASTGESR